MKRLLCLLLVIAIMSSSVLFGAFNAQAVSNDFKLTSSSMNGGNSNTEVPDGYVGIYSKEELDEVRNDLAGKYILMCDIEFSNADFSESGMFFNNGCKWSSIGTMEDPFSGVFDGNGYSINGYELYGTTPCAVMGLFGAVSGTVKNLTVTGDIESSIISSTAYVGGVCGYLSGVIENCCAKVRICSSNSVSNTTYISSEVYVGGVAGYSVGDIKLTNSDAHIIATPNPIEYSDVSGYVGGVVGYNEGFISYCENATKVELYEDARKGSDTKESVYFAGGIAGYSKNKITSCSNHGDVVVNNINKKVEYTYRYLGGITAFSSGEISKCYNNGSVDCTAVWCYVGGIVANNAGTITCCNNKGAISGTSQCETFYDQKAYIGGIAGYSTNTITQSYNIGDILWDQIGASVSIYSGGICGYLSSSVKNCYNAGSVSTTMPEGIGGGVVGVIYSGSIEACYDIGSAGNTSAIAGGRNIDNTLLVDCYYSNYAKRGTRARDTTVSCSEDELCKESTFAGFDFETVWEIGNTDGYLCPTLRNNKHIVSEINNDDFAGGKGTVFCPYVITNVEQLEKIRDYPYAHFVLANNIVFDGEYNWKPIEYLCGSLNGNGYYIDNLRIYEPKVSWIGFIGALEGLVVNLGIKNAYIYATHKSNTEAGEYVSFIGGIAGCVSGRVDNCYFSGYIYASTPATSYAGGGTVGGITGYAGGPITNCYHVGTIEGDHRYGLTAGGIAGYVSGGSGDAGTSDGYVSNCYNIGDVMGWDAGGIAGYTDETEILNCYNAGLVESYGTTNADAGGIVGQDYQETYICNNYNCGTVRSKYTGYGRCGGIIGSCLYSGYQVETLLENNYYMDNVGQASHDNVYYATCLTQNEMLNAASFGDFDFDSVWMFDNSDGYNYPKLVSKQLFPHGHIFTKQEATDAYKVSGASCTAKAVYNYCCEICDAKGTETYEYGEKLAHVFTKQVVTDAYKVSGVTCTAKAVYNYCCQNCDTKGTETYEYGEPQHSMSENWYYGSTTHFHKCTACGEKSDVAEHTYDANDTCTVCFYILGSGVSVSGNVTTYGDDSATAKIELIPVGDTVAAYTAEVTGNDASYSFGAVTPGEYTLRVSKTKHAAREYNVSISEDTVFDAEILLYGDVNSDGKVNAGDATQIKRYYNNKTSVFTAANADNEYLKKVADVNMDNKANAGDATQIKRYYNNKTSVFVNIP